MRQIILGLSGILLIVVGVLVMEYPGLQLAGFITAVTGAAMICGMAA